MHVLATAGHVDHGKSTLVRALTGMEPDRWAAERERGMTIDLGFAWTALPSGEEVAFVDVPGHERFTTNMLAGVGSAPAVLFVVAADGGWSRQSEEHLVAVNALGVRHGVLVITRSDLAEPAPALAQTRARLAESSLREVADVSVSARTGAGLPELRAALDKLVVGLPTDDPAADVRFWVDRSFAVKGIGTVVTGTLIAGSISVGDRLTAVGDRALPVEVRGLQSLKRQCGSVGPVARVAINLRGVSPDQLGRGWALLTPDRWQLTDTVDVRVRPAHQQLPVDPPVPVGPPVPPSLPAQLMLHLGTAQIPVRVRALGGDTARLQLPHPVPLRIGDAAVLRDPAQRTVLAGLIVLDVAPPALRRRGAAARRAEELADVAGPSLLSELGRRKLARGETLLAMGVPSAELSRAGTAVALPGGWYADPAWWHQRAERMAATVQAHARAHPESPGMALEPARQAIGLPDRVLVEALIRYAPTLSIEGGAVFGSTRGPQVPDQLRPAFDTLRRQLQQHPFQAPEADTLSALGLSSGGLARLVAAKQLLHIGKGIYLLPTALPDAVTVLAGLSQPFTLSEARQALDTTRRVAVPLLELLDQRRITVRNPDSSRSMRQP